MLGAGAILPRKGYGCSGYALRSSDDQGVTLFDCGPGTIRKLADAGIELREVRRVVLSHYHPDHCLDVFALAFARRNPSFRGAPGIEVPEVEVPEIEIIGPRGLGELLERGARIYGARTWLELEHARVTEIEPELSGATLEREELALSWAPTHHTHESVAWRAEVRGGRSVAYSGDSGEVPELAELARGADLFVCECSFQDAHRTEHHLTPTSAARVATAAACERLLLTHFYPEVDPEEARAVASRTYGGPIELAEDGSVHAI